MTNDDAGSRMNMRRLNLLHINQIRSTSAAERSDQRAPGQMSIEAVLATPNGGLSRMRNWIADHTPRSAGRA